MTDADPQGPGPADPSDRAAAPAAPQARAAAPATPQASAAALLRRPKLWIVPTVLSGLLALLLSLLYMGGIVNPQGELKNLPIALVNGDTGKARASQRQRLGPSSALSPLPHPPNNKTK